MIRSRKASRIRPRAGIGPAAGEGDLRTALELPDGAPLLAGELLDSLRGLARYLHAPLGEVLATALPAMLRRGEPLPDTTAYAWVLDEAGRTARVAARLAARMARAG